MKEFLGIVVFVSCGPFVYADTVTPEPITLEACAELIANTPNLCEASVETLTTVAGRYSLEHPDFRRACSVSTHLCLATAPRLRETVCEICSCSDLRFSGTVQPAALRELLASSPQTRLDAAVDEGDLRFYGLPGPAGLYTPCHSFSEWSGIVSYIDYVGDVRLIPLIMDVDLSEEHAELNRRVYVYATKYNFLLLKLMCSDESPLSDFDRSVIGRNCSQ